MIHFLFLFVVISELRIVNFFGENPIVDSITVKRNGFTVLKYKLLRIPKVNLFNLMFFVVKWVTLPLFTVPKLTWWRSAYLLQGSMLFGDKAYNNYEQEHFSMQCDKIQLRPLRKSNSVRLDMPYEVYYKNHVRKMIENSFAKITDLFPRHIHATSNEAFLLKIFIFILAFTIL